MHLLTRSTPFTTPRAQMPKEITVASTAQKSICPGSPVREVKASATCSVVMAVAVNSPRRHFQK